MYSRESDVICKHVGWILDDPFVIYVVTCCVIMHIQVVVNMLRKGKSVLA